MTYSEKEFKEAMRQVQDRLTKDAAFGIKGTSCIPFVSTARMRPSIAFQSPFRTAPMQVISSPYVVEKVNLSRQKKEGFWAKVWRHFWLDPWPCSLIEYYEIEKPAMMFDRRNSCIICHPSIENEIKQAVREGKLR